MDKQPVGQLPDLTQSNNDDEIMVITDSEHNQLKKEKISDFITDLTSTDENNAIVKGTDGKLFTKDFGNASNITEGTLPVEVLPDIPKDKLPEIETTDLPVSGVTADTYAYPSSVTVNAQGQVTAIEEGTPSGVNANTDLSNLSPEGEKHFLNKTQISNCILEIPQNIKLELNNGTVILKAGSIITIPDGFENDGTTLKFNDVTVENDISFNIDVDGTYFIASNSTSANFKLVGSSSSGSPDPNTNGTFYYDLSTNLLKDHTTAGDTIQISFPLAKLTVSGGKIVSIDQVFNGISYIGSTTFINNGIKSLFGNGRNPDGTLKNYEATLNLKNVDNSTSTSNFYVVLFNNITDNIINSFIWWDKAVIYSDLDPLVYQTDLINSVKPYSDVLWYNPNTNIWKHMEQSSNAWSSHNVSCVICARGIKNSGSNTIKTLYSYNPIDILAPDLNKANISLDNLNASGKNTVSSLAAPSDTIKSYSISTRSVVAPADGYLAMQGQSTGQYGLFYMETRSSSNNKILLFMEQYGTNGEGLNIFIRASKGQKINIQAQQCNISIIQFVYSKGEV